MARIGWGACGVCGNPEASITKNASETISVRCHRCEYSGFAKAGTKAARAILAQMTPDQDAPAADSAPLAATVLLRLVARARLDADLAQALARRLPHRVETLGLFMMADARGRALMIARMRETAGESETLSTALEHGAETALRRIEAMAIEGATEDVAAALAEACRCDTALARAIVADTGGEPLVIALRALGLRPEIVTRIFLFVDPNVSHARGRVSALARLASGLSQQVARHILDAMSGRTLAPVRHAALHDQTARLSSARVSRTQSRAPRSMMDLLKRPA